MGKNGRQESELNKEIIAIRDRNVGKHISELRSELWQFLKSQQHLPQRSYAELAAQAFKVIQEAKK